MKTKFWFSFDKEINLFIENSRIGIMHCFLTIILHNTTQIAIGFCLATFCSLFQKKELQWISILVKQRKPKKVKIKYSESLMFLTKTQLHNIAML